jgi:hypothetical protein
MQRALLDDVFFAKHYCGDVMGGVCSTHGEHDKCK